MPESGDQDWCDSARASGGQVECRSGEFFRKARWACWGVWSQRQRGCFNYFSQDKARFFKCCCCLKAAFEQYLFMLERLSDSRPTLQPKQINTDK